MMFITGQFNRNLKKIYFWPTFPQLTEKPNKKHQGQSFNEIHILDIILVQ